MAMTPFNLSVFLTARCWLLRRQMSCQSVSASCDRAPDHHRRTERAGSIGDMLVCAFVDHDNINFFSNRPLEERLDWTITTPEQVAEAMRVNEVRRIALEIAFFAFGSITLLPIFPSHQLPDYKPGEVPGDKPEGAGEKKLR
jgi:hypothetical protein